MELIDLSQTIAPGGYARPFHPKPEIWSMMTHEESSKRFRGKFSFQAKAFKLSDHSSTHVDAFNHFDPAPEAPSIDHLPLERFITGALCIDLSGVPARTFIEAEHIEHELDRHNLAIEQGDTFLYYTGHYERWYGDPEKWWTEFAGLSRRAGEFLAERGVANVGCEAFTIENPAVAVPDVEEPYLRDSERALIKEVRLKIVSARDGESLSNLSQRVSSIWDAKTIAVFNGLSIDRPLRKGKLIKVAIAYPYQVKVD